jgi:type II secretory pathway pseudopilin PulG
MELMVVIVIIGIVATGAAMGLGATKKAKLRSATWAIVSASKYAFSRAVSRGVNVRMVLDFDGRSVQLQEAAGRLVLNREDETGVGLNRKDSGDVYQADGTVEQTDLKDRLRNIGPKVSGGKTESGDSVVSSFPVTDVFLKNLMSGTGPGTGSPSGGQTHYQGPRFATIDGNQGKKIQFGGDVGFYQVYSPHSPAVIDKGFAFVYYFAGGTTEHTYVQISDYDDEDATINTVEIHPLNGHAVVHHEEISPEGDLEEMQEGDR